MEIGTLIIAIIALGVVWVFLQLWTRWKLSSQNITDDLFYIRQRARLQGSDRPKLDPESRFIVRVSELEIVCERPDGMVERVEWNDLHTVAVRTTSEGPLAPDVFWVLLGKKGGCLIPHGATGDADLFERLTMLPGFNIN